MPPIAKIMEILGKDYPKVKCSLDFTNDTELFVSICLSANCSDAMVNRTTPSLFSRFKSFGDFADADRKAIERLIRPIGLYRAKSRNLKEACRMIIEIHGGEIPSTMEELIELPGVGRKIANVLLAVKYGINVGIAVDTHVARLSQRLGLSKSENRAIIERNLMALVPKSSWDRFSLQLIYHGRKVCNARKPKCNECSLSKLCPSAFKLGK
ncbi:MAG: endonuclease III [Candidatus Aenigmarchaeota archaeon]|nr:endonuclease III [Candidatus Aenigmarchaeota archaeon]